MQETLSSSLSILTLCSRFAAPVVTYWLYQQCYVPLGFPSVLGLLIWAFLRTPCSLASDSSFKIHPTFHHHLQQLFVPFSSRLILIFAYFSPNFVFWFQLCEDLSEKTTMNVHISVVPKILCLSNLLKILPLEQTDILNQIYTLFE